MDREYESDERDRGGGSAIGFKALRKGGLSDQLASQLTQQIAGGTLEPGFQMPNERELAGQFGVGLSVVREAMRVLQTRGLVRIQQGQGTTVNPVDDWNIYDREILIAMQGIEIEDVLEIRRIVEPAMSRLATERATEADIEALRSAFRRAAEAKCTEEHVLWSMAFHDALADATRNPLFKLLTGSIASLVQNRDPRLLAAPGGSERVQHAHASILEAIESGDSDRAAELAALHIDQMSRASLVMAADTQAATHPAL